MCAIFYYIGDEGLRIYNTFSFSKDQVDQLEFLIESFDNYFIPRKNIEYERHNFFIRKQQDGESLEHYLTILKNQALNCEFGSLKEDLIKSIFICGIVDNSLRERLLELENKNLEETYKMAQNIEKSKERSDIIKKGSDEKESLDVNQLRFNKINQNRYKNNSNKNFTGNKSQVQFRSQRSVQSNRNQNKQACRRCGLLHDKNKCPAFNSICKLCSKRGHYSQYCLSRSRNINFLDDNSQEEQNVHNYFIGSLNNKNNKQEWTSIICIEKNNYVDFKLDTGAMANVISLDIFNSFALSNIELETSAVKLTTFSGQSLPVTGKTNLVATYKNKSHILEFFIVDTQCPSVLGLDGCTKLNLVQRVNILKNNGVENTNLISKYKDRFNSIGCIKQKYHISLDASIKPVIHAARKIPLPLLKKLKQRLLVLERDKIITRVDEPTDWVNSIVIVRKPNGDIRICMDPKDLNKAVRREHFQLPTIDEITSKLGGSKYFSTLDASNGFWQVPLDEESSKLCTFNTPFGRWRYLRLPFGLNSASEVFHKYFKAIFNIDGCELYIDEIFVHGKTKQEHDLILKKVLERAREANVTFNRDKCHFYCTEINFLGHTFTSNGVKPQELKIKAVLNMKNPTNKKEVQQWLGIINYVARFIPNLSSLTEPLRQLIKIDVIWDWNQQCEDSIRQIKLLLTKAPVLQYFDVDKPSKISVDSSQNGLGACLLQNNLPCYYASKSLNDHQQRFAQIEKECLAILFGCERFEQFIFGKSVEIETDHKPLLAIFKKPLYKCPVRLQRMLIRLQRYDIKLKFVPGKDLHIADALSRNSLPYSTDKNLMEFDKNLEEALEAQICLVTENDSFNNQIIQKLKLETQLDPELSYLSELINKEWPKNIKYLPDNLKIYNKYRGELSRIDDLIYKSDRILIPKSMRLSMLERLHQSHQGKERTKALARETMFWPGMTKHIEDMIEKCETCLTYRKSHIKEPMIPHELPLRPWQKLGCDVFFLSNRHYLIVVDYYSKYVELALLEHLDSATVITHMKSILARHGIPDILISDQGPQFSSLEFKTFARKWDFRHIFSSPTYAQSNGMVERAIQTVKSLLKKALFNNQDPYLTLLHYRNTPIDNLGSPSQLLMSRRLKDNMPVNIKKLSPHIIKTKNTVRKLRNRQDQQKKYYDRAAHKLPPLKQNQKIMVQRNKKWYPGKIKNYGSTQRTYKVELDNGKNLLRNRRYLQAIPTLVPEYQVTTDFDDDTRLPEQKSIIQSSLIEEEREFPTESSSNDINKTEKEVLDTSAREEMDTSSISEQTIDESIGEVFSPPQQTSCGRKVIKPQRLGQSPRKKK